MKKKEIDLVLISLFVNYCSAMQYNYAEFAIQRIFGT